MARSEQSNIVFRLVRRMAPITVIILSLLTGASSYAQRYPFHNLSVDDGLIQSQATSLAQDRNGNLWIGTFGGLSRYDGRNFTSYTIRNGLPSNIVWAVAADTEGNIWVGGPETISKFDGKTFTHYSRLQQQTVGDPKSRQQIQIVNDTAWWLVAGDIYYVTHGKIKYYVTPGSTGFVSALLAEKNSLWLAKEGVIYHQYNNHTDTLKFNLPAENGQIYVYRLFRDKEGKIWMATSSGLYRLNGTRIQNYHLGPDSLSVQPPIGLITQDRAGAFWLGMYKGVLRLDGNRQQYYSKRNGLSDNSFFDLFTDREGNVWMGSDGQGVFRYSGTQFTSLDETMGLPSAQIMAIASNKKDSLFLGSYDAGLYIFKDGKVGPLSFPSSPVPSITALCYTRASKLWIGTRGRGLWSYGDNIFRQYASPERNLLSNSIISLYEDDSSRLWIGFQNGAMVLEHDSFKTMIQDNRRVSAFIKIGADSMLIAAEKGLQMYNAGVISDFKTRTIVDSLEIQCFVLEGRNIWMGSPDNGVIRYSMDTRKAMVINKSNGLRSDFIYNIIADNEGNIWVGTGFGIHKIKMGGQGPQITFYGKAQGITGMESNINSVLKLPDGSIWFGTTNGAMHYQPNTAVVSSAPVSIVLQSVKLAGDNFIDVSYYDSTDNWYGIPYHLQLPYRKNNIAFTYQAVTLSGGQQVLYRYRMEGLETPWSDWSPTNSVTYSALPPGKYVFHVQCKSMGVQYNTELVYAFEIITPFHKTTWFRFAVLGACILLGIIFQYMVNSRKQRRLRLLAKLRSEEQAKIRLRTAEDFHDEIGNKLTRINVLTNVLKSKVPMTPDSLRILGQIEDNTAQLYGGTRDILWSLKPSNDNLYEILHRIRDFGVDLFGDIEVVFTFSGTDEKWRNYRLPMDLSRNLIMIFKEALNNCLKYSGAKNVSLDVQMKSKNVLQMVLKDDGAGFDIKSVKKGNGINNMHIRAERLNGKLYVDSRANKGTIISLTFKIPLNR